MEKNKVIFKTKPKIFHPFIIAISLLISGYFIITPNPLLIKVLMCMIFIIPVILNILKSYFANGIVISEDHICLFKKNIKGKTNYFHLDYKNIKSVRYNEGGLKQDRAIYLETREKPSIKILIPTNTFEFGHVLKFLFNKGIRIELVHSDHELSLFIDGKIDEFPMQNEPLNK